MPARLATSSSVVRSYPFSRIRARAASSSAVRVRSRLSPFGLPRGDGISFRGVSVLAICKNIVYLFYMFNIKCGNTVENAIGTLVDAGELAGAAALAWRDGEAVQTAAVGCRHLARGLPVERDTIFRIASMTKPVTTVAALMLLDEGRFALDDSIATWAPELAELRVLRDPEGPLDATDAAIRSITFRDLLTHRSGFTSGDVHRGPIRGACTETLGPTIDNRLAPDEWIARLATL